MEVVKLCQNCGEKVITEGRTKFCSAECQNVFYYKDRKIKEKVEIITEETISKETKPYKECLKVPANRVCKVCGKEFVTYHNNQIYCGEECKINSVNVFRIKNIRVINCGFCGKEFTTSYKKKYCGKECYEKNQERERKNKIAPLLPKNCNYCGKEFMPTSKLQLYCDRKCRETRRVKAFNKIASETSHCLYCGKEFYYNSYSQVYCSKKCGIAYRNMTGGSPGIRSCEYCKKLFHAKQQANIYCSPECNKNDKRAIPEDRACGYCGKIFHSTTKSIRKFCSKECSSKKRYGDDYTIHKKNRICKHCGKEFEYKNNRIYCSKECVRQNVLKRNRKPIDVNRTCKVCGKEFVANVHNKMICSQECVNKYWKEKYRKYRICKVCGEQFVLDKGNKMYCSALCSQKGQKILRDKRNIERKLKNQ